MSTLASRVAGHSRRKLSIPWARKLARMLLTAPAMRTRNLLPILLLSVLAACAVDGTPGLEGPDDIDDSETFGIADIKADSLNQTATYFSVSRDLRKCAAPDCGGWWVSRVNREWTKCHDGKWRNACYAVDVDAAGLGLSETEVGELSGAMEQKLVVLRGGLRGKTYAGKRLGQFKATEAWHASNANEPRGELFKVTDKQLVCIYAPCPSLHEAKLNSTVNQDIHALDLTRVGDETLINDTWLAMESGPVLVAGTHSTFKAPLGGRTGTSLDATQVYTRVTHDANALVAYAPQASELIGRAFSDPTDAKPPYPRTYRFDGATLFVEDAVAPCAPGAVCFWSGIVSRSATWSLGGDRVSLSYTSAESGDWGIKYYDRLQVKKDAAGTIVLVEEQGDGLTTDRTFRTSPGAE